MGAGPSLNFSAERRIGIRIWGSRFRKEGRGFRAQGAECDNMMFKGEGSSGTALAFKGIRV